MPEPAWSELCVGHPAGEQDALLLDVIWPSVRDMAARSDDWQFFFLRETADKQPYLRLRLRTARSEQDCDQVRRHIEAHLTPSPGADRFRAHPYQLPRSALGGPRGLALMESFLADTASQVFESVARTRGSKEARLAHAFDKLVIQADVTKRGLPALFGATDIPVTFLSYRSHADGFFIMSRDPDATRRRFDAEYERNATVFRDRLRRGLRREDGADAAMSDTLTAWRSATERYLDTVGRAIHGGEMRFEDAGKPGWLGDGNDISVSAFHQVIQGSEVLQTKLHTNPDFLAMRTLLGYLYWHISQLGLTLIDRFLLCHCAARAFEEEFHVDPAKPPPIFR